MDLLRRFRQPKTRRALAYSLIDVGRDSVKVAIIQLEPDRDTLQVVGHGRAETGDHDITGGRLEADAVLKPVNAALTQAEDSTEAIVGKKVVPDDAIFILAGRATLGQIFTVNQVRSKPMQPVSAKELQSLRRRAERLARQDLAKSSFAGGQWQPLAVTDAGTRLDDRFVLDGSGLTGKEIVFSVFGIAGQASALRALQVLANRLDLAIANIVALPHALAALSAQTEAIMLDIGHAGTDVCLIRHDALVATDWTPFGGHFFTQALARELDYDAVKAGLVKHAFAAGELPAADVPALEQALEPALYRWYDEVMDVLTTASADPLPRRIIMTGGGSLLPGLDRLLRAHPEPFDSAPEISRLGGQPILAIKDLTGALDHNLFGVTLSAAIGIPA